MDAVEAADKRPAGEVSGAEQQAAEAGDELGPAAGGSYEVLRNRLREQGLELGARVDRLNQQRKALFGGTELTVIGNERVRTENNCIPIDIVPLGDWLLFGYSVYIGLKSEITVGDVFSLHRFGQAAEGFDFSPVDLDQAGGFLREPAFVADLKELYQYYKEARLQQLRCTDSKLLAIFQIGNSPRDIKVLRWVLSPGGPPRYLDNRGERDHLFPSAYDFEWTPTTRENQVPGRHPHVSVLDEVFVESVGGDLTIKVENNTDDGMGIYREPVEDPHQGLDDGQIHYAKLGGLILLRVLPFREQLWRYFVFNCRTKSVERIDSIGQACIQLPEDHGIIFPGGYYLRTGERKVFEGDTAELEIHRVVRSPNGEDVLYIFLRRSDGHYLLLPYNVIRKEVQNPIQCHGYSIFEDGKMVIFRVVADEPTRVHPMQIWQTPFTSLDFEASVPASGSYLAKVGNADLVRGISDAYSVRRAIESQQPTRQAYEDLVSLLNRIIDSYFWLAHSEVGELRGVLQEIRQTVEQVIDEFEKVLAIQAVAEQALVAARQQQQELLARCRLEDLRGVADYIETLAGLRGQRGRLISLREMRQMDLEAVGQLEQEVVSRFDQVSQACVAFLLTDQALQPLGQQLQQIASQVESAQKQTEIAPLVRQIEELTEGVNVLSEVTGGLKVDDAEARTRILEAISEIFAQLNRVRATLQKRRQEILTREGQAEFAAQFKLLSQSIDSALARSDTPETCDEQLARLMLQLEEIESRFSEFDEFIAELAAKREEIYQAFAGRKQALVEQRQHRAQSLMAAAARILEGVTRRSRGFTSIEELNGYFSADPMLLKLHELVARLQELGDSVKAEELQSRVKSARQDALRLLRDRDELFEDDARIIRFGRHRFSVNKQALELTMIPREGRICFHLTGTDYYQPVADDEFERSRELWQQPLVSENAAICRAEFLAASILLQAEQQRKGLSLAQLEQVQAEPGGLTALVRRCAADRYDEGYERGVHDADAGLILEQLLRLRSSAGLLRFDPGARALACLFWATFDDQPRRRLWQGHARSLQRLRTTFNSSRAAAELAAELSLEMTRFAEAAGAPISEPETIRLAGEYLAEELMAGEPPTFITSSEARGLCDALLEGLEQQRIRPAFEQDLGALEARPAEALSLAEAWLKAFVEQSPSLGQIRPAVIREAAVVLISQRRLQRQTSRAPTTATVEGLLSPHPRIRQGRLTLCLDEFLLRLGRYLREEVSRYRDYRKLRQRLVEQERARLRLDEFKPRVLTSFVRNKLINEVYLPIFGDNLAKQLGSAGENKRTDLMGLLLLISPPGYGKTTLMEYLASQLGLVFLKVNGPALGHRVTSLDPAEAASATARQEVEKINLAFEMGNNVMLYLDDIQHASPELLQKFISLCDAQRRVEGVWRGTTRTYDLRGKRFCMVMAGNPYTEQGERFQIPDMLANRADTYNLGEVLEGQDDLFALSYIENALTSNPTLAPLAGRSPADIACLIRMARGEEVPATELSYPYSATEISEMLKVLRHLFALQEVLLKVNQQYIASASQDDRYRSEPPFQLQGSYRNMNKLAEKVAPAMNERERQRLLEDHYLGEAQTLTRGTEQNLLKLAELRGTLTTEQRARWTAIKEGFNRSRRLGGAEDDPAVRVIGQLCDIGERLDGIRLGVRAAAEQQARGKSQGDGALGRLLGKLDQALDKLQHPQLEVNVAAQLPPGFSDMLDQQTAIVERVLLPLVRTITRSLEEGDSVRLQLIALLDDLKRIDQRLKQASPEEIRGLAEETSAP